MGPRGSVLFRNCQLMLVVREINQLMKGVKILFNHLGLFSLFPVVDLYNTWCFPLSSDVLLQYFYFFEKKRYAK